MKRISRFLISLLLISSLVLPGAMDLAQLEVLGYSETNTEGSDEGTNETSAGTAEGESGDTSGEDNSGTDDGQSADDTTDTTDPSDPTDPTEPADPSDPSEEVVEEVADISLTITSCGVKNDVTNGIFYLLSGRSATVKVKATTADAAKTVSFKSNNLNIAKVTAQGKITALKKGSTVITVVATGTDGTKIKKTITVKVINSAFQKKARYKGVGKWKSSVKSIIKRYKSKTKGRVIFYGSSSIRRWTKLKKDMSKLTVQNHGFGGSTVNDCLYYADQLIIPYAPKAIVFYAGTNDIAFGYTPAKIYSRTKEFFKYIHNRLPNTKIYYIAQTKQPKRARYWRKMQALNAKVKAYAKTDPLVTYIDTTKTVSNISYAKRKQYFLRDGLHFTRKGYKAWITKIRPVLYKDLL